MGMELLTFSITAQDQKAGLENIQFGPSVDKHESLSTELTSSASLHASTGLTARSSGPS